MVKANTITAAFSLIILICMASLVNAGDRSTQDATPHATVSLSQIKFSASEINKDQVVSTNPGDAVARKNTAADARDDAKPDLAKNTDSVETVESSTDPTETGTAASLSAGGSASAVAAEGNNDAASGAAPVFLGSADDTCMGSSAAGGQGTGFGFSLGSTWTDENCKMLKNARELKNHGHHAAAKARLCMDDDNALAFELAGEPCPRALPSAQAALWTIRQQNPSYQAATEPTFQVAVLTDVTGRNKQPSAGSQKLKKISSLSTNGEESAATSKIGTLIAMMVSAVNQVASAVSPDFDSDLNDVVAMDGIE